VQQTTTTYPAVVGGIIAQLRKNLGVPQADLAAHAGLNQPAWSKIERGLTAITVEQLALVSPCLGWRPGDLLGEADRVVVDLARQGVRVVKQRPPADSPDAGALLGAAVVGALIGALIAKS
jgi:transcriptional regulator with XRE-family HTH domain